VSDTVEAIGSSGIPCNSTKSQHWRLENSSHSVARVQPDADSAPFLLDLRKATGYCYQLNATILRRLGPIKTAPMRYTCGRTRPSNSAVSSSRSRHPADTSRIFSLKPISLCTLSKIADVHMCVRLQSALDCLRPQRVELRATAISGLRCEQPHSGRIDCLPRQHRSLHFSRAVWLVGRDVTGCAGRSPLLQGSATLSGITVALIETARKCQRLRGAPSGRREQRSHVSQDDRSGMSHSISWRFFFSFTRRR